MYQYYIQVMIIQLLLKMEHHPKSVHQSMHENLYQVISFLSYLLKTIDIVNIFLYDCKGSVAEA